MRGRERERETEHTPGNAAKQQGEKMEGRETEQSDAQLRLPLHKKGHTTTLRESAEESEEPTGAG